MPTRRQCVAPSATRITMSGVTGGSTNRKSTTPNSEATTKPAIAMPSQRSHRNHRDDAVSARRRFRTAGFRRASP